MDTERIFLHDISSPLSAIYFIVETTMENLQETKTVTEKDLQNMKKTVELLQRVNEMIHKRQQIVRQIKE